MMKRQSNFQLTIIFAQNGVEPWGFVGFVSCFALCGVWRFGVCADRKLHLHVHMEGQVLKYSFGLWDADTLRVMGT